MFLTPAQIFNDQDGKIKASSTKKIRTKGSKPLSSKSFRDSTNTFKLSKPLLDSLVSNLKECSTDVSKKPLYKKDISHKLQVPEPYNSVKRDDSPDESPEKWPEIENMHIPVEPEDDYEDIMPKSERLQQKHIDALFWHSSAFKLPDYTFDLRPTATLEEETYFDYSVPSPTFNCSLYDDTELFAIELPGDDFSCAS